MKCRTSWYSCASMSQEDEFHSITSQGLQNFAKNHKALLDSMLLLFLHTHQMLYICTKWIWPHVKIIIIISEHKIYTLSWKILINATNEDFVLENTKVKTKRLRIWYVHCLASSFAKNFIVLLKWNSKDRIKTKNMRVY